MNVLEILNKELYGKKWFLEEKIRYLYIRSCELFCYDERYNFYGIFKGYEEKQKEIKNRKIDLENVIDNRVVCTSYSREVFSKLLYELLNVDSIFCGEQHSWLMFFDGKRLIKADSTIFSDFSRVKMNLTTKGYNPSTRTENFYEYLKQQDKKINYIDQEYQDYFLERIKKEMLNSEKNKSNDEILIDRLYTLKNIFESYNTFNSFFDADFCISYLRQKFLGKEFGDSPKVSLFNMNSDEYWDMVSIYPIELEKDIIYFVLKKCNNKYNFYEINKLDAMNYVKSMDGINKELIYRRK